MERRAEDNRPGVVFIIGNGLSIGASDAFRAERLTEGALAELPAKSLPFLQALAGLTAWDADEVVTQPHTFEELAGPLDHLAESLRLLPNATSEDLVLVESALRREYKRLVACVVRKVMEAGEPPRPTFGPLETREEINSRLQAASPSAGDLRPFARKLYEFSVQQEQTNWRSLTSIFTLNYDDLLERALLTCMKGDKKGLASLHKRCHLGFGVESALPTRPSKEHVLEIQHLHGCIYWAKEGGEVRWYPLTKFESLLRAWRQGRRQEADPVVILGNYKSQLVRRPPFDQIYAYCRARLTASRVCVVAGYGLADLPVNRLLGEFLMRPENTLHIWTVDVAGATRKVADCTPGVEPAARVVPHFVELPEPSAFTTLAC